MGVDRRDYVIIGYKLPYDVKTKTGEELIEKIWEDEMYLPMLEGWQNEEFILICDGMSGEYIAFGKEIASADEYEGFDFVEVEIDEADFDRVKIKANTIFPDIDYDFTLPKILIFTYYH